ncbi:hypothetical protein FQR65_LT10113 [Abscondita terminalis]|nr:hypothetical protein FQR65_LT10113 [Abscondita terminalis]
MKRLSELTAGEMPYKLLNLCQISRSYARNENGPVASTSTDKFVLHRIKMSALECNDGIYYLKVGEKVKLSGKAFSYTIWRTQIQDEVFWSMQGVDNSGPKSTWIITKYFGPYEQGKLFEQEILLKHPTQRKIKLKYKSNCFEDENRVEISKSVIDQFKNKDNTSVNLTPSTPPDKMLPLQHAIAVTSGRNIGRLIFQ